VFRGGDVRTLTANPIHEQWLFLRTKDSPSFKLQVNHRQNLFSPYRSHIMSASETRPPQPGEVSNLPGVTTYITGHSNETGKAIIQSTRPGNWPSYDDKLMGFNVAYTTSSFPVSLNKRRRPPCPRRTHLHWQTRTRQSQRHSV
jgi:hypothetical protein